MNLSQKQIIIKVIQEAQGFFINFKMQIIFFNSKEES